jgi:hypothetical protein
VECYGVEIFTQNDLQPLGSKIEFERCCHIMEGHAKVACQTYLKSSSMVAMDINECYGVEFRKYTHLMMKLECENSQKLSDNVNTESTWHIWGLHKLTFYMG